MRKYIALIILAAVTSGAYAQRFAPNYNYIQTPKPTRTKISEKEKWVEWVDSPRVHAVSPEHADQPAVYLLRDVGVDYRSEGGYLNSHQTFHYIVKVLDERGVETFNKFRLPVGPSMRVPLIKARTISPNGKVRDIAKDMIKVTKDRTGYYAVIIAFEGVEINSEIELLAKFITPSSFYHKTSFQTDIPIVDARFTLSYPSYLNFAMKSHNGFPELKDSTSNKRKFYEVKLRDIPAIKVEPHSFSELHRMAIEYRVQNYKGNTERARLNTWDDYARNLWNENYKLNDKERAAVNKFLSELGVRPHGNELANIKKIEDGIKTKITQYAAVDFDQRNEVLASRDFRSISLYSADYDDKRAVLDSIISKRAATPSGIVRLFAACLTQAGIEHEIGTTGDRSEYVFDKNFENWEAMDYVLFYFPGQKKYLAPASTYLRFPMVPEEVVGNKGVFCAVTPNNTVAGSLYNFRTIKALGTNDNQANITAGVTFTKDMDAQVDVAYAFKGLLSTDLREKIALTRQDKMKELVRDMLPFLDKPENLVAYSVNNDAFTNYYDNKPLEVRASVNTTLLTEKAGKNYLFKVGALLGDQDELYSENERSTAVDLQYPQSMNRTITVNIPKGYKVLNAADLRMNADYVNDELEPMISFNSDYKLVKDPKNGDKLIITVKEQYSKTHFSTYEYERYRKVVNTAADFNKVALLLSKKPA